MGKRLHAFLFAAAAAFGAGAPQSFAQAPAPEAAAPPPAAAFDFKRDVQPIFQARCHECHGAAKQKGELRLDRKDDALRGGLSGAVIIPGKSIESLLVKNIERAEGATPMPPQGDPLSAEQIALIRAWIDAGAVWPDDAAMPAPDAAPVKDPRADHWSFHAPARPELPAVQNAAWVKNPIDLFVLARLEKEGLPPSPEADRYTLARRLYLDLIGLPPSVNEVDAFVGNAAPTAYEDLVDSLLASPRYGERWGRRWLDAARYADTNGYEKDRERSIWPYRDWVIRALNADMPFDQFAIEQIAGDMLPNATDAQRIATGFHRNTMLNEEGGIDVEEFRFASVVDRVHTTGAVFLGLTVSCAQCHDHKYDPISHKEYYQFFSFLNNADEPEISVPTPAQIFEREAKLAEIAAKEAELPRHYPPFEETMVWETATPTKYRAERGALLRKLEDQSLLAFGHPPAADAYEIEVEAPTGQVDAVRIETLTHEKLPAQGPGRADHGNFVLSEFSLAAGPKDGSRGFDPAPIARAEADHSQKDFNVDKAFDGKPDTGWAIGTANGKLNVNRTATFYLKEATGFAGGTRMRLRLEQAHGDKHTIGRLRVSFGKLVRSQYRPELALADQRKAHLEAKMGAWEAGARAKSAPWSVLDATEMISENGATLEKLPGGAILVSGDRPNKDVYRLKLRTEMKRITALRIDALPHWTLANDGPGRGIVSDPGNFMINEVEMTTATLAAPEAAAPAKFKLATADYAQGGRPAEHSIDGKLETGWAIGGGQGKPHSLVLMLEKPIESESGVEFAITLRQHFIHQDTLGHFRISATGAAGEIQASGAPAEIEAILLKDAAARSEAEKAALLAHYCKLAPELAAERKPIDDIRRSMRPFPTTLVMQERKNQRKTQVHPRGEFLRTGIEVEPGVPAVLPQLAEGAPRDRLGFARWLVDRGNPLTARVQANRAWQEFFGRGIVATVQDFGLQGEKPTHPELLDWLAVEFMEQGWSQKKLHRLIVTSAAYRQSSRATPELLQRDSSNVLLARAPRLRVEAEIVRDLALETGGVLSKKMYGPSVFPPQPAGITELAYGSPKWNASTGEDRYRRGVYTHLKRTAPYASFMTFDGVSADQACPRRTRSNTPLQALTLMNDEVFLEAAQGMARRLMREGGAAPQEKAALAIRLCVARPPDPAEAERLAAFYEQQLARFRAGEADAVQVAALDRAQLPSDLDVNELAAWTLAARVALNLDETITRE